MSQVVLEALQTVSDNSLSESGLTKTQFQRLAEASIVSANPNIVSGAIVFAGTRVPVYNLWDYLKGGDTIDVFLESFPTVRREQIQQALKVVNDGTAIGRLPAREHSL